MLLVTNPPSRDDLTKLHNDNLVSEASKERLMPKPAIAGGWVCIKKLHDAESINIREVKNFENNREVEWRREYKHHREY